MRITLAAHTTMATPAATWCHLRIDLGNVARYAAAKIALDRSTVAISFLANAASKT
jgi:hypothetical protein